MEGRMLLRLSKSASTVPFFTMQQVSSTYLFQSQGFIGSAECNLFKEFHVEVGHSSRDVWTHRCAFPFFMESSSVAVVGGPKAVFSNSATLSGEIVVLSRNN